MKPLLARLLTTLLLFIEALVCLAIDHDSDDTKNVQGVVVDSETGEPLPFAHVYAGDIRTVTNIDGEFTLTVPNKENTPIEVSFMGYETANIDETKEDLVVKLKPSSIQLEAVTVKTGESIMWDVFNNLQLNYEFRQKAMNCYYKETLEDSAGYYYLAEGVLEVFQPNDVSPDKTKISPVKVRKQEFKTMNNDITMIRGHASDMLQSLERREKSFIHQDNFKHYEYTFEGLSSYKGSEVFIVKFEPTNKKAKSRGILYVDAASHAVIKAEYFPLLNSYTLWDEVSWVEEFSSKQGIYTLDRVMYKGNWSNFEQKLEYTAMLVVTESEVVSVPPALGLLLDDRDVFAEATTDFSEAFWEDYNFIKLSSNEKSTF